MIRIWSILSDRIEKRLLQILHLNCLPWEKEFLLLDCWRGRFSKFPLFCTTSFDIAVPDPSNKTIFQNSFLCAEYTSWRDFSIYLAFPGYSVHQKSGFWGRHEWVRRTPPLQSFKWNCACHSSCHWKHLNGVDCFRTVSNTHIKFGTFSCMLYVRFLCED